MTRTPGHPLSGPLSTRADVERAALGVCAPAVAHLERSGTRLGGITRRGHDADAAGLEGFARPLWGLVPLAAGGGQFDRWARIREGLEAGTDPNHPDHWGTPHDHDQRLVEMAPIAFGLIFARDQLWNPLQPATRDRVIRWLSHIDHCRLHRNNWLFFRILVDLARRAVCVPIDVAAHEATLDRIDTLALDDGWYSDSAETPGEQADWYSAFAHHVYGLLYVASGLGSTARAERFEERARQFALHHQRWFAPDGAALALGRSMTYRFAQAAFWGALAAADVEALPWAMVKGLHLRNLRHWSTVPITNQAGLLTVGYHGATPGVAEPYISSGSPYWAAKAFLSLLARHDHPFWTTDEQPLDDDRGPWTQPAPQLVITRDAHQVQALSAGQPTPSYLRPDAARYGRLAYSSHFPFVVDRHPHSPRAASESTISIVSRRRRSVRNDPTLRWLTDDVVVSRWQAMRGVTVDTALWGRAPWHLRAHLVTTTRRIVVADSGFALPTAGDRPAAERRRDALLLTSGPAASGIVDIASHGITYVPGVGEVSRCSRRRRSTIRGRRLPGDTALSGQRSSVPTVTHVLRPGRHLIITAVMAAVDGDVDAWRTPPPVPAELLDALRSVD